MKTYGIVASQQNKDVLVAQDTEKIIDSNFPTMEIAREGTVEQTGNSGATLTFTIRHQLDFVPFVLIFYKTSFYPTFWQWAPGVGNQTPVTPSGDANQVVNTDIRVDRENIVVKVLLGNGTGDTVTIKYYIFNTPIALSV